MVQFLVKILDLPDDLAVAGPMVQIIFVRRKSLREDIDYLDRAKIRPKKSSFAVATSNFS